MPRSWTTSRWAAAALLSLFACLPQVAAQAETFTEGGITYIQGTDANGVTRMLRDDRDPALYTGDFTDCLGGQSLLNVTKFDAAYYADNMTVLFHLEGTTNVKNESIMAYISVFAYGEDRFDLTFNPCSANIYRQVELDGFEVLQLTCDSLCPLNASIPVNAGPIIPVSESDVSGIPAIALSIPDFDGSAMLRLFSNSTQTEIACFQAVMTNGASLSQPAAIGSALGAMTLVALIASFAMVIYGDSIPEMRTHYAHSMSVLVVFEVFQSIFFTGAISMDWPAVCAAWWSNFAWSAGMIYTPALMTSINNFLGTNQGNSSQVGGAGSDPINNQGGLQQQIYGRSPKMLWEVSWESKRRGSDLVKSMIKRSSSDNVTDTYHWGGGIRAAGLPAPGDWTGFAGELSDLNIPVSNAFLTGLVWLLALVGCLLVATVLFKGILECFSAIKMVKKDRFSMFRNHWLSYLGLIVLRTALIAFFMISTLSLYQLSYGGPAGVTALAAVIFIIFFLGMVGLASYACFFRLRLGRYESSPDRLQVQSTKVFKVIPWFKMVAETKKTDEDPKTSKGVPFFRVKYVDDDAERTTVHEDAYFNKRFGWLSARYRRTKWWWFTLWIVFQFLRACFLGGAQSNPQIQVAGLLVVETIALIGTAWLKPYESRRNTALAVYMLGISRIIVLGLSITLLPSVNFDRILATVIGFVIVVVQGFLVIGLIILIVLGAFSSYMSLTRNREEFKPKKLVSTREKYFDHVAWKATDLPRPPPPTPPPEPELPPRPEGPYFYVNSVRRAPKIEDEDDDDVGEIQDAHAAVAAHFAGARSRANSMRSTYSGYGNLPYGARPHRASWSSRDFTQYQQQQQQQHDNGRADGSMHANSRPSSGSHFMRHQFSNPNLKSTTTLALTPEDAEENDDNIIHEEPAEMTEGESHKAKRSQTPVAAEQPEA